MFEYKDDFLMCPVHGLTTGDDSYPFCSVSDAAKDDLAELARLVGDGQTLRPADEVAAETKFAVPQEVNSDWTQATEATAPNLNYDLEKELSRAFGDSEPAAPVVAEPAVEVAVVDVAETPSMAFEESSEIDANFSNTVADELDRALAEEVAAEAALDAALEAEFAESLAPVSEVDADEAVAAELSHLVAGTSEPAAMVDVPMPTSQAQTLEPWTAPEIVEVASEPVAPLAMPEAAPETLWQEPAPMNDFSDPAEEFHAEPVHAEAIYAPEAAAAAVGAVAATATAKPVEVVQTVAPQPAVVEDELFIPDPHVFDAPSRGGAGKRVALAVVAVAMMGGVAAAGWNMFDGADGPAPTILASVEPTKVKPKNTGGKVVPNQDQEVYKSVGGEKTAPKQTKLKDTSEKPIKVVAKATPNKVVARASAESANPVNATRVQTRRVRTVVVKPDGTILNDAAKPTTVAATNIVEPTLAIVPNINGEDASSATTASVKPVKVAAVETTAAKPVAKVATQAPKIVAPKKVAVKKVPVKKVAVKKAPVKAAPVKKPEPTKVASVSSPYAVQISSQRSAAAANASYANLSRRYASVLGGKGVDIRKGVVKGKDYYRVRIPANTRSAANQICSQLKARGGDCFVTR